MTMAVGITTGDGIVLATDTRTSRYGNPNRVLSENTQNIIQIGKTGVAVVGWAFLLRRYIGSHLEELASVESASGSLQPLEIAQRLSNEIGSKLEEHFEKGLDQRPTEGSGCYTFLIAGYERGIGKLYQLAVPGHEVTELGSVLAPTMVCMGETQIFNRLFKGFDTHLLRHHAAENSVEHALEFLEPHLAKLEYSVDFGSMTLNDASEFGAMIVQTTIDMQRFANGTIGNLGSWPGVGGSVEVATIGPRGFEWAKRRPMA